MFDNDSTTPRDASKTRSHSMILWILCLGLAVALAGNVYQYVRSNGISRDLALNQQDTQSEIAKLTNAASAEASLSQQRFDALKDQLQAATTATLQQTRSELKRSSTQLSANLEQKRQELEQKHQEIASQLADLKQDTSTKLDDASVKLSDTNTKLQDTDTKLDQVSTDVAQHGADLKRMVGDMGVMSGDIATNGKELAALKELGDRNYFEFHLAKTKAPQKVGDIQVLLKKTDPKHNRFTVTVLADDKTVEKRDRSINEPVQLYVGNSRQPYEIVVNQVNNNEIIGYLATPKVKTTRGQQAAL